ncbi:MAG: molecular chaperone DnaK [Spirochaetes bacterium]|nr:molecular chaperone DnaK [Spirochaetota bacterium]
MGKILGIDLGTTNSVASIYYNGEVKLILNEFGEKITPSVVYINENGEILVGSRAKNMRLLHPDNTISSVKRLMGTNHIFKIGDCEYSPEQISSYILKYLKDAASNYIGEDIFEAVITVPAYFNDNQRKATIDAGKLAGLEVKRIINEPTASCLAYGLSKKNFNGIVLVYDFGGGTFDVSILDIGEGVYNVISTCGDNKLGGIDFDKSIVEVVCQNFLDDTGIDLHEDRFAMQKLYEECEKAKISLSTLEKVRITIPFISANKKGPLHLDYELTRKDFEEMISQHVDYTIKLVEKAILDANLELTSIDKVLLVGGSSNIPLVKERLSNLFGNKIDFSIKPDECVSIGASIQGAILNHEVEDVVLVDVIPISLGVEVEGNLFVPIINRNTQIPAENSKIFTTIKDGQKAVEINVYQGERKVCSENIYLGKFTLENIREAKAGEPKIRVIFSIDVDGKLEVKAFDEDTKAMQAIKIDSYRKLTKEEIDKIIEKAREFEDKDLYFESIVRTKTKIKSLKQKLEEHLKQINIDKEMYNEINFLFEDIEKYIEGDDINKLKDIYNNLVYYCDELSFQKEKFISEGLLKED